MIFWWTNFQITGDLIASLPPTFLDTVIFQIKAPCWATLPLQPTFLANQPYGT
jgi:hypothetical protein